MGSWQPERTVEAVSDFQFKLIRFIEELKGMEKLSPEESLLKSKLIKSFEFVQILLFIEESAQLRLGDGDITPENFETVSRIADLVERKKQAL